MVFFLVSGSVTNNLSPLEKEGGKYPFTEHMLS